MLEFFKYCWIKLSSIVLLRLCPFVAPLIHAFILVCPLNIILPCGGVVIAGGLLIQAFTRAETARETHREGPHHLIILMMDNMAMIDKAWILSQLIQGDIEISVFWTSSSIVIIFCPSYSEHIGSCRLYDCSIFPS